MKSAAKFFAAMFLLCCLGLSVRAQDEPPAGGRGAGGAQGGRGAAAARGPRPYDQVITSDAKTQNGVFMVHLVKEKNTGVEQYYYEIPPSQLNKDFLWVSLIAKTTLGVGYGGDYDGNHVVRWERRDNNVYLRSISYEVVADPTQPISSAVRASNNDAIIMSFPIEAFGKDDAPVIEVTRLFATEVSEFSPRTRLNARGFDATRSYVDHVTAFPLNIEAEATQTFTNPPETPAGGRGAPAPTPGGGRGAATGMRGNSATVVMHYSMVKLPENPMMPRLFDDRVGYFTIRQEDFGRDEQKAVRRTYITRWRLEKKDPNAAMSEPVKPIVYYIDPATPEKWRKYVRRAIEDWQPAFEQAGFKNAIIAKDAPTPEQDPTWSAQDVRNSIIRWLPSTTENSVGPSITDPRTGEILNADVEIYHNVMNLARDWYFIQVGPLDKKHTATLPLPDEVMGRLIEYVIAHEVGHTLGFQHNMKSSSLYTVQQIRNPAWVHANGHVATLMDYSRFNYVAQPEDNIPWEDLIPKIGPYDKWATHWGYAVIPGAKTSDDEKPTLDKWTREQDATPYLRFSTDRSNGTDPGENTEAVGDADAVYSTGMGVKNLHRVMDMVVSASTAKSGEPYDDLSELYGRILGQWVNEMGHVAVIVGGVESQDKHTDQPGPTFVPTSRKRQVDAVDFLNKNAFATPAFLIRPEMSRLFEPEGVMDRIRTSQMSVLNRLLQDARISRMIEIEAEDGVNSYHVTDFLASVRHGIWSELAAPSVVIDAYRRNLQDGYIEDLAVKVNERTAGMEEVRALLRAEMKSLTAEINAALPKATDPQTRAHLEAAKDFIAKALDPKVPFEAATAAAAGRGGRGGIGANGTGRYGTYGSSTAPNGGNGAASSDSIFDADPESLGCWPDYIVRPSTASGIHH
jgi:hypothetical protein